MFKQFLTKIVLSKRMVAITSNSKLKYSNNIKMLIKIFLVDIKEQSFTEVQKQKRTW